MKALFEKLLAPENGAFHFKVRRDPAFDFCWHHHPQLELTLITASRGRRFVGDHIDSYGPGDLVLVGGDLPHTWCSLPEDRGRRHEAVVIQFDPALLGVQLSSPALRPLARLFERAALGLRFSGEAQREVSQRMRALPRLPVLRQMAELYLILERLSADDEAETLAARPLVASFAPGGRHPIDRVCSFLNERFGEPLRLAQLARIAAMSPSAFSRSFHRSTGKTVTGYITELRLTRACQLLVETDDPIADVAAACGFTNLSNFNRHFLRRRKMRPRELRAEVRRLDRG
jgi:AraC-like DNA-binding protein